jgi:hypothetical protein
MQQVCMRVCCGVGLSPYCRFAASTVQVRSPEAVAATGHSCDTFRHFEMSEVDNDVTAGTAANSQDCHANQLAQLALHWAAGR